MNKGQVNLQDLFLNQVRKEHVGVTIYLVSGVQLKGLVKGFDAFTVLLDSPGKPTQIIYKHAIASVVPVRPVDLMPQPAQPPQPQPQPQTQEEPKEQAAEE